ncbi:MAG: M23 family metallopeptidase [Azoarcus sp.]|jgi:murein DD-endopeptidase MepM/ murein hydrolase activator NlpD|nr:M23 family metallopeptidase [Azoarcus sp.]
MLIGIGWPLMVNSIKRGMKGTFGMVRTRVVPNDKAHHGWDLYAPNGTKCYSIADGEVVSVRYSQSYGNVIEIKTDLIFNGTNIYARYAHLSSALNGIQRGVRVTKGQQIGLTGSTGESASSMTGIHVHLHFEVTKRLDTRQGEAGLDDRYDPLLIYGVLPLGNEIIDMDID